jgi:hypothetical protein
MNPHSILLPLGLMARRLRVTNAWLRAEADAGRVPCLRAGKRYLFSPEAVERILAERAASRCTESQLTKSEGELL